MIRSSTPGRADASRPSLVRLAVLALACVLPACSRDAGGDAHARESLPGRNQRAYEVIDFGPGGAIRGTVELASDAPIDSTVHPTSDERVCGRSLSLSAFESRGDGVGGAVVWLADARRGRPLPLERRYSLTNARCLLTPAVQATVAGGTLNVRSVDPVVHRNRFVRSGEDTALALVQLNDEGQVVPVEHLLAEPGRIEVRCDQHPWTHGWLLVFDHPYFTATGRGGEFHIDSIPPGEYRLIVWHPRLGSREETVEVEAGREETVRFRLGK